MTATSWRVFGASVRGSSHEARDTPCQDAHAFEVVDDAWLVAAVADGAGSASHSQIGSALAVRHAAARLAAEVRRGLRDDDGAVERALRAIVEDTRDVLFDDARARELEPGELSCTFLLVLAGPRLTASIHVGDGAIVARSDGGARTFSVPEPSEHPNETTFLTSPNAIESARVFIERATVDGIALMSDGLQMLALKYPSWAPFTPFFEPLFAFVAKADDAVAAKTDFERFLGSKKVRAKTDDDVTLVLARRVAAPVAQGDHAGGDD